MFIIFIKVSFLNFPFLNQSFLITLSSFLQVTTLQDYFGEDHIFIAYGPEKHHLDDFTLDSEGKRPFSFNLLIKFC